ncbi:MAG: hypothetical protein AB7S26_14235 [Sandaracinaceae bacterium]
MGYESQGVMMGLSSLTGCIGWITAVVLLVVGFVVVRKVHPTAGYMLGAAGLLRWAMFCCRSLEPALLQAGQYQVLESLGMIPNVMELLLELVTVVAILASLGTLARAVTTRRAAAGGAA